MICDFNNLPHAGIQSLVPYAPGKSIDAVALEQGLSKVIKLASNENPLGCSPAVLNALAQLKTQDLALYPLSTQHLLHQKLASFLGIDADMLTLGNGSDALNPLLMICFALHRNKHILTHEKAFIAYEIAAKSLGIPVFKTPLLPHWQVDLAQMIAQCNESTGLIFLASPNNPTGVMFSQENIEKLLAAIPASTLLVVDEAYHEFVEPKLQLLPLLAKYPNLLITRTFSKAYGLAGLRLGYLIAQPQIIRILHRVILPFSVNQLALLAGSVALDDQDFIEKTVNNNRQGLKQLADGLQALNIPFIPSQANFITMDCQRDAVRLYQLLQEQGIIVRPLHPYQMQHYLRVSIGTAEQNSYFLDKIKEIYHEK
jgi:histidinol-phosphate aminotransferase